MMLPIDAVLDLLMHNRKWHPGMGDYSIEMKDGAILGSDVIELRTKVRTYLETLVPAPKLLSECEEGVEYLMVEKPRRVCRDFIYALDCGLRQRFARADQVQVIQPVEVNRE